MKVSKEVVFHLEKRNPVAARVIETLAEEGMCRIVENPILARTVENTPANEAKIRGMA